MSEALKESLSDRERQCLEHVHKAEELDVSFGEYCRTFELNANAWYAVRQRLVRKGVVAGAARSKAAKEKQKPAAPPAPQRSDFAPVRIVPRPSAPAVALRLWHASGWTIECAQLPDVSWVTAVMAGERK